MGFARKRNSFANWRNLNTNVKTCTVRGEILSESFETTDGKAMVEKGKRYPYRWINDTERFEININGTWHEAESIDFNF
jgi:hypothetical protein